MGLSAAFLFVGQITPRPAAAAGMDITPERLVVQPLGPNNVAWANIMSELGMAVAPTAMHPARTVGPGGFSLSLQASLTTINANAVDKTGTQYWHAGTQGSGGASANAHPDSILGLYSLVVRKGLPFGFEVSGAFGYLADTSLLVEGGDLRWAVLEGFRSGPWRNVPDVAIGGALRTVTGGSKFSMTVIGIDGQVSKPVTVAGSAVLTPYAGAQHVIILAQSDLVDLTPGVPNDADFSNDRAFQNVAVHRWRAIVGADYAVDVFSLGAQMAVDITAPSAENASIGVSGDRQWTLSIQGGVSF